MPVFGHKLIRWPWSYKWPCASWAVVTQITTTATAITVITTQHEKVGWHERWIWDPLSTLRTSYLPFTSWVLEIWISIHNVIKDDNYAGEIVNKGALNIAFSRLNLHTQLIFVLATILTFQIINRTLKSLKLLKTLLCFKWVWQTVSKTSKADFFDTGGKRGNQS